jgi:hypothetical protein
VNVTARARVDGSTRCRNHADRAATLRCDECGRQYCRDCVVERWVTSRSSVWVCRRCVGGWQPTAAGGVGGLGSATLTRYGLLVAAVAAVALLLSSGGHGLLPG